MANSSDWKWRKTLWIWLINRLWLWLWWWLWLYNPAPQSVPKSHMVPLEPLAPPPPSVFLSTTQIYFGIFTNIVCDLYKEYLMIYTKRFCVLWIGLISFSIHTNKFCNSLLGRSPQPVWIKVFYDPSDIRSPQTGRT